MRAVGTAQQSCQQKLEKKIDEDEFDGKTSFRILAATLHYMSLDRSDVQFAPKEMCSKMANPTRGSWKKVEESMQIFEGSGEGDVGDTGVETRRCGRGCARGFGLGIWARKEVDEERHDDGQRHSGETLVENAGFVR